MSAANSISVSTRLAASRPIPALAQLDSALSNNNLGRFRRALLRWYDRNRRHLPWRETRDPYRIWISEIMLQQTRVAAVLDHYRIFLKHFPNVQALAASSEDDVLAAWSGLGYYRRARMLHQCAKDLIQKHSGRFPRNSEALLALPGIGRYTAAAIASIAFDETVGVVDGNVERVLQRLIGTKTIGIDLTVRQSWQCAQALLDNSRPGDFNQAMMELGATVCVPREPRCLACPVRKWCATRGEISRTVASSRQQREQIWCVLDWRAGDGHDCCGGEVRLVQRPRKASLMPGMWELPQFSEPPRSTRAAHWRTFRHSITVTDYTVHVLRNTAIVWEPGRACPARSRRTPPKRGIAPLPHKAANGKWMTIDRIPQIPITGLTRKILKAGGII